MASGNNVTDPYTPSNDTKLECLKEYRGCSVTSPNQLIAGEKGDRGFDSAPEKGLLRKHPFDSACASTSRMGCVEGNASRKLLTVHRRLMVELKSLIKSLKVCNLKDFEFETRKLNAVKKDYENFRKNLCELDDIEPLKQLSVDLVDKFEQCLNLHKSLELRFCDQSDDKNSDDGDGIEPCDSASLATNRASESSSSRSSMVRRIGLDRKRAKLKVLEELAKSRQAKARADAESAAAKAKADAEAAAAAKAKLEAEETKTLAELRMKAIELEAEEKFLAFSEQGSSVSKPARDKISLPSRSSYEICRDYVNCIEPISSPKPSATRESNVKCKTAITFSKPTVVKSCNFANPETKSNVNNVYGRFNAMFTDHTSAHLDPEARDFVPRRSFAERNRQSATLENVGGNSGNAYAGITYPSCGMGTDSSLRGKYAAQGDDTHSTLHAYLERQGRNEYISLASQVGYDGTNIAVVFFANQVRRLMDESPYDERRLEVLRASCTGQPSEMVNLFCAPMKSMTTSQRIEKALDGLRQRYGVSGGLTSEPKIMAIRHGVKVSFNATSLKLYNEDLNTLEVYAYAHDEYEKLSGQLLLDTANRLPNVLKRRYLDYLDKNNISLNQPSFESLRKSVVHEIKMTTSDYAQAFFKSDERDKLRDPVASRGEFRVRQVGVVPDSGSQSKSAADFYSGASGNGRAQATSESKRETALPNKQPPICFVCSQNGERHYLADCSKFLRLSPLEKRRTVVAAGRCLNCLSTEHFVRDCSSRSKCRTCGPYCRDKHIGALHDCYSSVNHGTANTTETSPKFAQNKTVKSDNDVQVQRVSCDEGGTVLLRTSAVRVVNLSNGRSTLAYAQHDTASQATLISDTLKEELGLKVEPDPTITIRTLADQSARCFGRTSFTLKSLANGEVYDITDALVVPSLSENESTLPHAVDTGGLIHFRGVKLPVIPNRKSVDILIGQSDKLLLTVLKEQEGQKPDEPNLVFTRLGPIASEGRVQCRSSSLQTLKIQTL